MGKFDSFKKKVSDVADKATDKAKDLADKTADKAKDMAEIGKLNMSLADKRKDLDKAYTKLGKGFFEKEENLETSEAYLEMDMTGGYRKLMHELFPQAKIIVDKYHYVRQITYALERVRVEEQKKYSEQWRRYFKRSKYVLLKDTRKLTMEDRLQLDNMFRISKDLYKAYQLKQQFEHVKESSSREEAAKRLSRWIMDAQKSGLMEFIKVSFTYQNWSKEILNSFEYPYTNGYIEGCNNRIKVLKRISFGMPRFVRFRRRIMHIMLN